MKNLTDLLTSRNLYYAFLHVALVVLAIQVVVLSRQNRQFKEAQSSVRQESVKVGDYFSLSGIAPVDRVEPLDSTSRARVFFVFTTHCPFCKETLPFWNQVAQGAKGAQGVAHIGICLDPLEETKALIEEQKPTFPVFVAVDKESFVKTHKLHGVPQTILTTTSGRVEKVWKGRLSHQKLDEVVKAILDSATIQHSKTNLHGGVP